VDDVAALLALTAAVCFALAATLWQKAALNLEGVSFRHPLSFAVLLGQSVWLLGLLMQIVGVALQAAALDRGRVSIIQPLLVTTVIWALPLGYFLTHQTVGRREILGPRSSSWAWSASRRSGIPRQGSTTRPTPTGRSP